MKNFSKLLKKVCIWSAATLAAVACDPSSADASSADGGKIIKRIQWSHEKAAGNLTSGEIVEKDDRKSPEVLAVHKEPDGPSSLHVLAINDPGVGSPAYVLKGQLRYENVNGGYLELLNYFAGQGPYFTRTLSPSRGPMQELNGSHGWREFQLPFSLTGSDVPLVNGPTKLELNVVLPKGGAVHLRDLKLVQLTAPLAFNQVWSSGRPVGMLGAGAGVLIGCFGAMVGILESLGRGRTFVIAALVAMMMVGVASLVAGSVAFFLGEPYAVYFPLIMMGLLGTILPPLRLPGLQRRYQQLELRRMEALDAR